MQRSQIETVEILLACPASLQSHPSPVMRRGKLREGSHGRSFAGSEVLGIPRLTSLVDSELRESRDNDAILTGYGGIFLHAHYTRLAEAWASVVMAW